MLKEPEDPRRRRTVASNFRSCVIVEAEILTVCFGSWRMLLTGKDDSIHQALRQSIVVATLKQARLLQGLKGKAEIRTH